MLNVPFYETSAKTGENVEDMFEAVVREVLSARGALPDEDSIFAECRWKHGAQIGRKRMEEMRKKTSEDCSEMTLPRSNVDNSGKLDLNVESLDVVIGASEDGPLSPQIVHRRRRESMFDRCRNVFSRRSAVLAEDVAD
jgi:hypothetical protein